MVSRGISGIPEDIGIRWNEEMVRAKSDIALYDIKTKKVSSVPILGSQWEVEEAPHFEKPEPKRDPSNIQDHTTYGFKTQDITYIPSDPNPVAVSSLTQKGGCETVLSRYIHA